MQTSDETYDSVEAISKAMGKTPVQVRNSPGFVVNRLLCPMINEAIFAYGEGLTSAQEIDDAIRLGCNHPRSHRCARPPFALERLELLGDDQLIYRFLKPQPDGRTELHLTPLELIARLAALIPPPRRHRHR